MLWVSNVTIKTRGYVMSTLHVSEFIEFYNQHIPQHSWVGTGSTRRINSGLGKRGCSDGTLSEAIKPIVRSFVEDHNKESPHQWAYWSKLDSREFPVVKLLVTESDGQ